MSIASAIATLLILIGLFRPKKWLMICTFVLVSFGTFAIVNPNYTSGATILVSSIAAMMLVVKFVVDELGRKRFSIDFLDFRCLGFLSLFTLLAVLSAVFFPALFAGSVDVMPLRPRTPGAALVLEPLQFSSSNVAQGLYMLLSFLVSVAFFQMVKSRRFASYFKTAVLCGGVAVMLTGLMDVLANLTGLTSLLAPFRNASYIIGANAKLNDLTRIVGLMSEASAFAQVSITFLSLLLFGRHMFSDFQRRFFVLPIAVGISILAALSVSSTAYVALFVVLAVYFADAWLRLSGGDDYARRALQREMLIVGCIAVLSAMLLLSLPNTRQTIVHMFDVMVLSKPSSGSYIERTGWSTLALKSLWQSYGVGVGVGSLRTSNFFVNLLASTGVVGGLLFLAFLYVAFTAKSKTASRQNDELIRMAKLSMIPIFAMLAMVGTVPDYGIVAGALFGVVTGASHLRPSSGRRLKKRRKRSPAWMMKAKPKELMDQASFDAPLSAARRRS
jgi:hypothetical protein